MSKSIASYLRNGLRKGLGQLPESWKFSFYRSQIDLEYNPSPDIECRLAETREDLEAAFALLHDSYVKSGFMKPDPSGLRVTKYHALSSTSTLVLCLKGKVIATISLIRDNPFGLPMDSAFDLSEFRKDGKRLVEVSSLAVDPKFRGNHGAILWPLLKFMRLYVHSFFGADYFVIAVNPRREDFYRGILLFSEIENQIVSNYDFVNGAPAVGLYLKVKEVASSYASQYGLQPKNKNLFRYMVTEDEGGVDFTNFKLPDRSINRVSDPVMSPELLEYFFKKRTSGFSKLSNEEKLLMRETYIGLPQQGVIPEPDCHTYRLVPREQKRHDVNCKSVLKLDDGREMQATVLEASNGGLRIRTRESLPLSCGDSLNLKVALSDFEASQIRVRIGWSVSERVHGLQVEVNDLNWTRFISQLNLDYKKEALEPVKSQSEKRTA